MPKHFISEERQADGMRRGLVDRFAVQGEAISVLPEPVGSGRFQVMLSSGRS